MARLYYFSFEQIIHKYYEPLTSLAQIAELLLGAAIGVSADEKYFGSYEASTVSRNRAGKRPFSENLLKPYGHPDIRRCVIEYFKDDLLPHLDEARRADLLEEIKTLIKSDGYIAEAQKEAFAKLAALETLTEFLAEVHIYAVKKTNDVFDISSWLFHNLPYSRNPHFIGRDEQLERIHNCFYKSKDNPMPQAISGLGGVGKTQIALEYAHRFALEYDVIWWMSAESADTLMESVTEFVVKKKLAQRKDDAALITGVFLDWFDNHKNWLLIYDNADNFDITAPFVPKHPGGHILFTTRLAEGSNVNFISVETFDLPTAADFLVERTGIDDGKNAGFLAYRLGFLPLALEQAAAYISVVPDMDIEKYLALLEQSSYRVLSKKDGVIDYKEAVTTTWKISMEKIQMPSARQLLYMCSYFAADAIGLHWFIRHSVHGLLFQFYSEPLNTEIMDEITRNDIVRELTKYSLVKCEQQRLYIHRLRQEVIRFELENEGNTGVVIDCLTLAGAMMTFIQESIARAVAARKGTGQTPDDLPEDFRQYLTHIVMAAKNAEPFLQTNQKHLTTVFRMFLDACENFYQLSDYEYAESCARLCNELCEFFGYSDLRDIVRLCFTIGGLCNVKGNIDEAIIFEERAFAMLEKAEDNVNDLKIAISDALIYLYGRNGNHAGVERFAAIKKALDPINFAFDRLEFEMLNNAKALASPNDTDTQRLVAQTLSDKLSKAVDMLNETERVCGPVSMETISAYFRTGQIFQHIGDYEAAEQYYEKALKILTSTVRLHTPIAKQIMANSKVCTAEISKRTQ